MRDSLPRISFDKECGVLNLDDEAGMGTHWVAYIINKKKNVIKYFDSFGNLRPPTEVISYLGSKINYNYIREQDFDTFICGHLCLRFLLEQCNIIF